MLGSDFEGFLYLKGSPIPAERVLGGHKNAPITLSRGVVGHPDNIMAEAALSAPVEADKFADSVTNALNSLKEFVAPATFHTSPAIKLTKDFLKDCKYAGEVGCSPDFDVLGNEYQYSANDLGLYRYAGFHIHFDVNQTVAPEYAVQVVDCTIGLASIAFQWDSNQGERRKFYGNAGRHRVKPYGIEYRTLSSSMLDHLYDLQPILSVVADALVSPSERVMMLPQMMWNEVQHVIQTEDVAMANVLWEQYVKKIVPAT